MAREYFKNLPNTTTPLRAERINGLLNGEESIEKIVAGSIEGKNLFDKDNDIINGYFLNNNGGTTASQNDFYQDKYIKINTDKITVSSSYGYTKILEYDEDKNFLHYTSLGTALTLTITLQNNTKYIRISGNKASISSIQLEKSSTATDYVPFMKYGYNSEESMGNIKVDSVTGKNKFDINKQATTASLSSYSVSNNILTQVNSAAYGRTMWKIDNLELNKKHTISLKFSNPNGSSLRLAIYDASNNTEQLTTSTTTSTSGSLSLTFTANTTTKWIRIYSNASSTTNTYTVTFSDIQLELGEQITSYTPYKSFDNSESEVYSTNEIKIGRWIDGKILYRKTINTGALPNNTTKIIAHNISNIDFIVHTYGSASNGTNFFSLPLPYNTLADTIICFANKTNVLIATGTDRSSYTTSYVTLEYTKTTD